MKNITQKFLLPLCLISGLGLTAGAYAQDSAAPNDKDAARQTKPDNPKAAYQRKVREIRSAHRDNLANCKTGEKSERSACVKEANQILKSDLAQAKQLSQE
jgi:hypothetical protein